MSKPELGTERLCAHCSAKFYDLHHSPIACPKCGRIFEAVRASSRWRADVAAIGPHECRREATVATTIIMPSSSVMVSRF
jgi:uncharacterized protein (TIGR02300 family)